MLINPSYLLQEDRLPLTSLIGVMKLVPGLILPQMFYVANLKTMMVIII